MNEATTHTAEQTEREEGAMAMKDKSGKVMRDAERRDLRNVRRALKLLQRATNDVAEASRLVSHTLALDVRGATQALAEIGGRATAEAADALGIDLERMERGR